MKFPQELVDEATEYLMKKTGQKPNKKLTGQFLKQLAELGKLFKENSQLMGKES